MKFAIHYNATEVPFYDLIFDDGKAVETLRIPEDFFFDLMSGSPVEYEKISGAADSPKAEITDSGEFTRENGNIVIKGGKTKGRLSFDKGAGTMTLLPL